MALFINLIQTIIFLREERMVLTQNIRSAICTTGSIFKPKELGLISLTKQSSTEKQSREARTRPLLSGKVHLLVLKVQSSLQMADRSFPIHLCTRLTLHTSPASAFLYKNSIYPCSSIRTNKSIIISFQKMIKT